MTQSVTEYPKDPKELVGRELDGRYAINGVLGAGGMGVVLGATHKFLKRDVAIKLLHPELLLVEEARARFLREAEASSAVNHPNVVEVTDFGVTQAGLHYLVLEHLPGDDLIDVLERLEETGEDVLPGPVVARVGLQVCAALEAIHTAGFVHRDLKPENLRVLNPSEPPEHWHIKVLDFGIAGIADPALDDDRQPRDDDSGNDNAKGRVRLTQSGRTLGSANYMSPEQVRGDAVDQRTDIYAMGCVLYELATGEVAFSGNQVMAILMKHLNAPAPLLADTLPDAPTWLGAAIARCLHKDPDYRFQTASDLAAALSSPTLGATQNDAPTSSASRLSTRRQLGAPPAALPTSSQLEIPTPQTRRGGLWALLAAAVVLAVVGAWLATSGGDASSNDAPAAVRTADRQTPPPVSMPDTDALSHGAVAASAISEAVDGDALGSAGNELELSRDAQIAQGSADAGASPAGDAAVVEPGPTVTLDFQLEPAGTQVWTGGKLAGTSPFKLAVPRSEAVATYELVTSTGDKRSLSLFHSRSQHITLTLGGPAVEPAVDTRTEPKTVENKRSKRRKKSESKKRKPTASKAAGAEKKAPAVKTDKGPKKKEPKKKPSVLMQPGSQ